MIDKITIGEMISNNLDIICRMKTYVEYANGDKNLLNSFIDKAIERAKKRIYEKREL